MHDMPIKNHARLALLGQLLRYGLTGLVATLINIGIYHTCVTLGGLDPNLAWAIGFVGAAGAGFLMHGAFSFRGHGGRDRQHVRFGRFMIVSLIGFAVNSFWVWLLVQYMDLPLWAPYPLVLFVTPLMAFWLNRQWVFE